MIREQHGAICSLDIRDVLQRAWGRQQGDDLPSSNCYFESITLEEASNDFDCDMFLTCLQSDRIGGTFSRGRASGDDANHMPEQHLWIIHSGDHYSYGENSRILYEAQDFVGGKTFRAYNKVSSGGVWIF